MNSLVSPLPASTAVPLCLSDGRLNPEAVGWSARPQLDCHIPGHFGRRKRWNHWCITTPNWMLAITLADLDLMGFAAAYFLDLHSGKSVAFTRRSPLASGCELADTPQASQAFEHPQLHIRVDEQAGRTRLSVNAPDIGGQALQVELDIQRPAHLESMNLVVPFAKGGFHASCRQLGLPVTGSIKLGTYLYQCIPGRSFAALDFGRGLWPHNSDWSRVAFAAPGGIAGNFGTGWTDGSGLTDNALWFGGKLAKLDSQVSFSPDNSSDPLSPWSIRSECGRVDLIFSPRQLHRTCPQLGPLYHDNRQWFGEFSGVLLAEDSDKVPVHSALGWIGLNQARW